MNLLKTIKDFVYKESLPVVHMDTATQLTLEKLSKRYCEQCEKLFKSIPGKAAHMSLKHGIKGKKKPWINVSLTNNKDTI